MTLLSIPSLVEKLSPHWKLARVWAPQELFELSGLERVPLSFSKIKAVLERSRDLCKRA